MNTETILPLNNIEPGYCGNCVNLKEYRTGSTTEFDVAYHCDAFNVPITSTKFTKLRCWQCRNGSEVLRLMRELATYINKFYKQEV